MGLYAEGKPHSSPNIEYRYDVEVKFVDGLTAPLKAEGLTARLLSEYLADLPLGPWSVGSPGSTREFHILVTLQGWLYR